MINAGSVYLDTIEAFDLPQMRAYRNLPEIWEWCRQDSLISQAHHQKWFESLPTRADIKMFAIRDKNPIEAALVGVCGLTDINHIHQRAEFSLYVAPRHQRRGYARSALEALFSHGFEALNLNLIWGETFEGNPAANLFESLGMVREGERRDFYFKGGKFIPATLFSVRRSEWRY